MEDIFARLCISSGAFDYFSSDEIVSNKEKRGEIREGVTHADRVHWVGEQIYVYTLVKVEINRVGAIQSSVSLFMLTVATVTSLSYVLAGVGRHLG